MIELLYAMGSPAGAEGVSAPHPLIQLIPFVAIFLIFYFLLIRPQQKRAQEHRKYLESLQKGQEVMTVGGLYGKIVALQDNIITLEISENTRVKVHRQFISMPLESQGAQDKK